MSERILVTGVGGGVGQSIIKALRGTEYESIGVDSEVLAAGLYLTKKSYLGKYAYKSDFIDRLIEICLAEECKLLFPGHDIELPYIAENRDRFINAGVIPIVSSPEIIRVCDDKLETSHFLESNGFPAPVTCLLNDNEYPDFPVVLKPQRGGARSKDTYIIRNKDELNKYLPLVDQDNCIVQEYIEGDEYTCGTVNLDNSCYGVIVMRRILRAGDTYKAFVEKNDIIENTVREMVNTLKPFGACNVQLRLKNNIPYVFEINARCSGTTASRALAGFNEPKMISDFIIHNRKPKYNINEISILRYWQEIALDNQIISGLRSEGNISIDD